MKTITLNSIERFGTLDATYVLGTKYTMSDTLAEELLSRKVEGEKVFKDVSTEESTEVSTDKIMVPLKEDTVIPDTTIASNPLGTDTMEEPSEDSLHDGSEDDQNDLSVGSETHTEELPTPKRGRGRPKKVTV